jgi:hypothetical protein
MNAMIQSELWIMPVGSQFVFDGVKYEVAKITNYIPGAVYCKPIEVWGRHGAFPLDSYTQISHMRVLPPQTEIWLQV